MLRRRLCISAVISRTLRTSSIIQKQPPHDRQRRRRKMPPPFSSLPFYDEDPLKNLCYDHLFRPKVCGSWGSTSVKTKEKLIGQILSKQPTLYEKLQELYYHENNLWYHRLCIPLVCTDTLDFSQYITRTGLRSLDELKPGYSAITYPDITIIKNRIHELLTLCPFRYTSTAKERQEFLGSFMECFYTTLFEYCNQSHLRNRTTQADVGVKVETFFKRSGFAPLFDTERIKKECLSEGIWEATEEAILDADELIHFRICGNLAWQLRTDSPLPPFIPASEEDCFKCELPPDGNLYRPEVFGLDPINHYDFSCLPFVDNAHSPEYIRTIAGYWPPSPLLYEPVSEDSCKFGLLGVLDVTPSSEQMDLYRTNIDPLSTSASIARDALSNGLLAAFTWTSAMAYSQGFTLYNELERPFSAQLLLFDGTSATWQLVAYQLNSLCALWKAEDAGDPFNLLWHSPRIPMFHALTSAAQNYELNSEALDLITRAMLFAPTPARVEVQDHVRLIPDSPIEGETEVKTSVTENGGVEFSQEERAALTALEDDEVARRNHPIRVFSHPRPHPNEVFFLKLTEKTELLEEMREKMPAFGGSWSPFYETGSAVPEGSREALRQFRLRRRSRTAHTKVLRHPPRWR